MSGAAQSMLIEVKWSKQTPPKNVLKELTSMAKKRRVGLLEKLARFVGTNKAQVGAFEIDEDGRFLHWPHADVHLGWLQFQQLVDPAAVVTAKKKTAEYNLRYGEAIRAMRESRGLKQSEIAGITDRQLRRVEHGQQSASKPTLEALAKAHAMSLADYVEELAKRVTAVG